MMRGAWQKDTDSAHCTTCSASAVWVFTAPTYSCALVKITYITHQQLYSTMYVPIVGCTENKSPGADEKSPNSSSRFCCWELDVVVSGAVNASCPNVAAAPRSTSLGGLGDFFDVSCDVYDVIVSGSSSSFSSSFGFLEIQIYE